MSTPSHTVIFNIILVLVKDELPATADEAKDLTKHYTHMKEEMTKTILTAKLKAIKVKFRGAVDSEY